VTDFHIGDQVYRQSFSRLGNFIGEKAAFSQSLELGDTLEWTSTLPIAFSTALYGPVDLGRMSMGDSVRIQSATGAVGLAACQIAQMAGAEEKKEVLLNTGYGIKEDNIF